MRPVPVSPGGAGDGESPLKRPTALGSVGAECGVRVLQLLAEISPSEEIVGDDA